MNTGQKKHHHGPQGLTIRQEMPLHAEPVSRRALLKVLGITGVMGVAGCRRKPPRQIISRTTGPEYQKPGKALYYSSTWTDGTFPYGIVVKCVDGRPVKIEGNPDHPVSQGCSTAAMQASLFNLYDPNRLKSPLWDGKDASWAQADVEIVKALREARSAVILTRGTLGPSERDLMGQIKMVCPPLKHFAWEPINDRDRRLAWRDVYGAEGEIIPVFSRAKVVVSFDCDFLGDDGTVLEATRAFMSHRVPDDKNPEKSTLSRLYVIESGMSITGSNADHRIRLRPSAITSLVEAVNSAVTTNNAKELDGLAGKHHLDKKTLHALVADLKSHLGESVVVAGGHLPREVHLKVAQLNHDLKSEGNTLEWNPEPAGLLPSSAGEIEAELTGGVDVLICMGVNPVYDWPGGGFDAYIKKAGLSVGHSLYANETVTRCTFTLPSHHPLENWNDAAGRQGLYGICQPVIRPLFDSRQEAESLLRWGKLLDKRDGGLGKYAGWYDFVKEHWAVSQAVEKTTLNAQWEDLLRNGQTVRKVTSPSLKFQTVPIEKSVETSGDFELVIQPHHSLYDGRYGANGWLEELPEPAGKLVWDNAAAVSPATASKQGWQKGDMVKISHNGQTVALPVYIIAGVADHVVVTTLGHGQVKSNGEKWDSGVNVAGLMAGATGRVCYDVKITNTGEKKKLVCTQKHFSMEDRPIVLDGTLSEYKADSHFVAHKKGHIIKGDIYEGYDYSKGHKWAMAIDLGKCTGCGACTVACQVENNIPYVGKEECANGREMSWIRIDRYHKGDPDNPTVYHQPMLCQHCDNAPCENVCPVNATEHSREGLNEMVYNRCVGTRYCANNCPYKVRRFNFYDYQKRILESAEQELGFNPQVTVRSRGIMEKCTFCVQRINAAKFDAKNKGEKLADGDVKTACQQGCPAGAIVFGDINDPESEIAKLFSSNRAFHVLEQLNVKPNVSYLARVKNPQFEPKTDQKTDHGGHA